MKSWITTAIAIVMVIGMGATTAGAAEVCTPMPPKDVQGNLAFVHPDPSFAGTYFQNNACSWNGLGQLNGTDALVLDVGGMAGPATMTVLTGDKSYIYENIFGHFLDPSCQPIPGADVKAGSWLPQDAHPELITIPATAKWLVFDSDTAYPATDFDITLHSDGKACPVVPPKKKRKH